MRGDTCCRLRQAAKAFCVAYASVVLQHVVLAGGAVIVVLWAFRWYVMLGDPIVISVSASQLIICLGRLW